MPDDSTPLTPGDCVKLTAEGEKRYPHRKGQSGRVERLSEAAPGLVEVRWETGACSYHRVEFLEIDTQ